MIESNEQVEALRQAVAQSDLDLDESMALIDLLDQIKFLSPAQEQYIRTVESQFASSLELLRDELHMPWNLVPRSRISALAHELAVLLPDWSVNDVFLAGTFMAASARHQLVDETGDQHLDAVERSANMAALAASANAELSARNHELHEQVDLADDLARTARMVAAGVVTPTALVQEALAYAQKRGLKS